MYKVRKPAIKEVYLKDCQAKSEPTPKPPIPPRAINDPPSAKSQVQRPPISGSSQSLVPINEY